MAFDHLAMTMCLAVDASMFNFICVYKHKVWKENFENHDGNKEISEGRRENADAGL